MIFIYLLKNHSVLCTHRMSEILVFWMSLHLMVSLVVRVLHFSECQGVQPSLFQVDNFIHADMHPGNILVRVSHEKSRRKRLFKSKPHVVFLDVGMTAELSGSDRVNLLEFFKAVARRDGRTVAERALKLAKQQNCPDPEAFIEVRNVPLLFFEVLG